jgi:hypothetical protein
MVDFRKLSYEQQIKQLVPARVSFFEGDDFITVVSEKGVFCFKTKLDGATPWEKVSKGTVHYSKQFRLMSVLGFESIDLSASTWVRGNITVRFVKSRIRLLVDGVAAKSVSLEVVA